MQRRGFLQALIGAAILDPEKLLWVPGKKLISIPRVIDYTAFDLMASEWVRRYGRQLANNLYQRPIFLDLLDRTYNEAMSGGDYISLPLIYK